MEKEGNRKV